MKVFIEELADGHSHYQTPAEVQEEDDQLANGSSFVGIGASFLPLPDGTGSVIYVLPGSPSALAGILPHDQLVSVNGGPLSLPDGTPATRGEPGTSVTVQVRRGGGAVISLSMVRAAITAPPPVDSCLVAGTRIGYIFLPTFFDPTITDQVREALQTLMAGGPLTGLIIDNRMNSGGLESSAKGVLGFVTGGNQGAYVRRNGSIPFNITLEAIGNSQTVPWLCSSALRRSPSANLLGRVEAFGQGNDRRRDHPGERRAPELHVVRRRLPRLARPIDLPTGGRSGRYLGGDRDRCGHHRERPMARVHGTG